MEKLQIVVDTNVLVAAFRSERGAARLFLNNLDDPRWQINVSTTLLLEYEDVLKRPEMNEHISDGNVEPFLEAVCSISKCHNIYYLWRSVARDPNDAFILELAIRISADFIITFNARDFSNASDFGVKLATPREFLQFVGDIP
jgi:putative PIN family toxin of toxin-antitoxin system